MYISSLHETTQHEHSGQPSQETQTLCCRGGQRDDRDSVEADRGFLSEGRAKTQEVISAEADMPTVGAADMP